MSNDLAIMQGNLPAHLMGQNLGVTQELMLGMFLAGNRIGLKGSRFRLVVNGIEESVFEENYLDAIIVGAAPAVSRIFYEGAYNPNEGSSPSCYSADGIVPADDVKNKQCDKCMTCPQNIKGSKIVDGQQFKACSYFRRLVVALPFDLESRRVFKLEVKSQGLFGEKSSDGTKQNLNDYIKMVNTRGIDVCMIVTRISFDLNSSVPKLMFKPERFITADELEAVRELVTSEEVKNLKTVTMQTIDIAAEQAADEQEIVQQAQQATAQQAPKAQRPATPQQARPAVQQPPAQRPATPQQARPTAQQAQPATQRPPQPAAQQAPAQVQQRPAIRQGIPMPAQQPAQPAVQEVGTNDELADILSSLE